MDSKYRLGFRFLHLLADTTKLELSDQELPNHSPHTQQNGSRFRLSVKVCVGGAHFPGSRLSRMSGFRPSRQNMHGTATATQGSFLPFAAG